MTAKSTKWLIGAAVASLALNLFLATWLIAWGWRGGMHLFGHPVFGPPPMARVEKSPGGPEGLPPGLRNVIDIDRTQLRPLFRDARDARRAVGDALLAEPFDPARLDLALTGLRQQADAIQGELHRAMMEAAINGGPEVRRKMARPGGKERRYESGFDGMGRGDGPPPPPPGAP